MDLSSRIQAAVPVFIPPRQNSRIPVDSLRAKSRGEFFKNPNDSGEYYNAAVYG